MRYVLCALLLAISGCRKPTVEVGGLTRGMSLTIPDEQIISDGLITCELKRGADGHVFEKQGISLEVCFGIWLQENGSQDHYDEWFLRNNNYMGDDTRRQAEKHLLGRA